MAADSKRLSLTRDEIDLRLGTVVANAGRIAKIEEAIDEDRGDESAYRKETSALIEQNRKDAEGDRAKIREELKEAVSEIDARSDVADVVGSKAELAAYAKKLTKDDIVKVLKDESKGNETSYYRVVGGYAKGEAKQWKLVGSVDQYLVGAEFNLENGAGAGSAQMKPDAADVVGGKYKFAGINTDSGFTGANVDYGSTAEFATAVGGKTSAQGNRSFASGNHSIAKGASSHAEGYATVALGVDAHSEGSHTVAKSEGSHSEGSMTTAFGSWSHAEGYNSKSKERASHAEGSRTSSSGEASHSEGYDSTAYGRASHAEGQLSVAGKKDDAAIISAHAEGYNTKASASYAHSEGHKTEAAAASSHAEGDGTRVLSSLPSSSGSSGGTGSGSSGSGSSSPIPDESNWDINKHYGESAHAEGFNSSSFGFASHSEGGACRAYGHYSHAEGDLTVAGQSAGGAGTSAHAEGHNTTASGDYSHAEGHSTAASGGYSHAEGFGSKASNTGAHSEGYSTTASGDYSHAEGNKTSASKEYAHAEGNTTKATAGAAHAEGSNTEASGASSHAEGYLCKATKIYAHAEGYNTKATGEQSHAEGLRSEASAVSAHAEGISTHAEGGGSHAEGSGTLARGGGSHAAGYETYALGDFSYAGGGGSYARTLYSFAHGWSAEVESGDFGAAFNNGTKTTNNSEFACGAFNDSHSNSDGSHTMFTVGNGSSSGDRRNAFEVLSDGRARVQKAPSANNDVVRKQELDSEADRAKGAEESLAGRASKLESQIGGFTVKASVPANAEFTDTTYAFAAGSKGGSFKVTPSGGKAEEVSTKAWDAALAAQDQTGDVRLDLGKSYKLTAGGGSVTFKMPDSSAVSVAEGDVLSAAGGALSTKYTNEKGVGYAIGGLAKGTKIEGWSLKKILDKIFWRFDAPSGLKLTLKDPSGNEIAGRSFYSDETSSVSIASIGWSLTRGAEKDGGKISYAGRSQSGSATVSAGQTSGEIQLVAADEIGSDSTVTLTYEYKYEEDGAEKSGSLRDSAALKFKKRYKVYFGATSSASPTVEEISALTSEMTEGKSCSRTYELANQRAVYAYPKSLGALSDIKDGNNFDQLSSFSRAEVAIGGTAYYAYTYANASTGAPTYSFK